MRKPVSIILILCCCCSIYAQNEVAAPADESYKLPGDSSMEEIPLAPKEFRRPENFIPKLYPENLHTLSGKYSDTLIKRAKDERERINRFNSEGRYRASGKSLDSHMCPEWFLDAKLGIFIDWGLWSIPSWCPTRENSRMYPDWYELRMYSNYDPQSPYFRYHDYHSKNWGEDFERDHFIDLFKADSFNAEDLCQLFQDCGAKYVIPFSKHHSGFCLWDSSWTFRDVVDQGPHRDIDAELVKACRSRNLKFGFYFSLGEWEYPIIGENGMTMQMEFTRFERYSPEMESKASGKVAVRNYVQDYSIPQAVEFIDKYDPDILWYDYDWVDYATNLGTYDISAYFYNKNHGIKEVCVNDRYGNGTKEEIFGHFTEKPRKWLRTVRGDFYTDELGDTSECLDPSNYHPWECCRGISMSFGNHWGDTDDNVLSRNKFICEFADIVSRGGNLLFVINLGPQGDIPAIQRQRLLEIGDWLGKYGEAIYGTRVLAPYDTDEVDYLQSKDALKAFAIVKKPSRRINILCSLPPDPEAKIVGSTKKLRIKENSEGIQVKIPWKYVIGNSPFAIRFESRKGNP